jgi:hypothetical protein
VLTDPVERSFKLRFTPPCAFTEDESKAALLDAAERLAVQGVGDPLIGEVRAAILAVLKEKCAPYAVDRPPIRPARLDPA